jgi:thiol-disulfide isomerase/thioredoxin
MRKKINAFVLWLFCLSCGLAAIGQEQKISVLAIGDAVPDIALTVYTGDSLTQVRLKDYAAGAPVLVDTWNTFCTSCIASMPHILALQNQFKGKLKIICVAWDSRDEYVQWRDRMHDQLAKKIEDALDQLPMVFMGKHRNEVFNGLIEYTGNPTHLWIDQNSVYQARTQGHLTNAARIQSFLAGKLNGLDEEQPLPSPSALLTVGPYKGHLQSYSYFMDYTPGMQFDIKEKETDSVTQKLLGYNLFNQSALQLFSYPYRSAFTSEGDFYFIPSDRILLEVKDLNAFRMPFGITPDQEAEWYLMHRCCYGIKVPLSKADELNTIMSQDLDRVFNVDSRVETRKVKCLVLRRISGEDKLKTKHTGSTARNFDTEAKKLSMQDIPFSSLVSAIRSDLYLLRLDFTPFLDETNYKGNIDIILPNYDHGSADRENADHVVTVMELRETLRKYGLDLAEEYRERKMLVISDKPDHGSNHLKKL